jgi:Prohead core protein serine protease
MKLICELNESDIQIVTEATESGEKNFYIEGIFMQAGIQNKNGRVYPVDIVSREVDRYRGAYIDTNRAYGELGHPAGPNINLERVSHMIKDLHMEGSNAIGRAKIMDTPYGKIVKDLMKEGANLGVSSRGMGTLTKRNGIMEVGSDFYLATAADIVADPSAPQAFVRGIMEGKEWIWENGVLHEREISEIRDDIEDGYATTRNKEEVMIEAFKKFLSKL